MNAPLIEARVQWLQDRAAHREQEQRAQDWREAQWCGCQLDHDDPAFLSHPLAGDHKRAPISPAIEASAFEGSAYARTPARAPMRPRALARGTVNANPSEHYGLRIGGNLVARYTPESNEAA